MPLFVVHCLDHADALERRMAARPDHLAYVAAQGPAVRLAGPMLSEDGAAIIGSLFIVDMPDRAAVDAFMAADPYAAANVFAEARVSPFKAVIGSLG